MEPDTKKLHVAYLAGVLGVGGAEHTLVSQVKVLRRRGHDVTVLTFDHDGAMAPKVRSAGAEVVPVGGWRGWRVRRVFDLVRELRRRRPDVIHSQHFYANLYALLAGRLAGAVPVGFVQGSLEVREQLWRKASYRLLPWMTANSKLGLERLDEGGYSRERAFYLPNAVDVDVFEKSPGLGRESGRAWDAEAPVILSVGRLVRAKRHDRLLRVFAQVRERVPRAQLVIAGGGPLRGALEAEAKRLGVQAGVHLLGTHPDVPALLQEADVFALCSDHEGMPNAVQEAMAAARPVVVSEVGGVPELIRDGEDGLIVAREDEDRFAREIVRLLEDRALRERMGAAARERMRKESSLDALGDRLEHIYRSVLGKRPVPAG